jgi:hypothetical protein
MKKIFLNNWYYYFTALILLPLSILGPFLLIYLYIYLKSIGNPTIDAMIYFIIFVFPLLFYSGYLICKNFIQWTYIDEERIVNRNIFRIIREVTWKDILEIKLLDVNFSTIGTKLKWICLYDNHEGIKESNGIGRKSSYIMIRNTKKNKEIIEHYWGKSISNID